MLGSVGGVANKHTELLDDDSADEFRHDDDNQLGGVGAGVGGAHSAHQQNLGEFEAYLETLNIANKGEFDDQATLSFKKFT